MFVQKWDGLALLASYVQKIESSFCMMESVDNKLQRILNSQANDI